MAHCQCPSNYENRIKNVKSFLIKQYTKIKTPPGGDPVGFLLDNPERIKEQDGRNEWGELRQQSQGEGNIPTPGPQHYFWVCA